MLSLVILFGHKDNAGISNFTITSMYSEPQNSFKYIKAVYSYNTGINYLGY